MPDFPLTAIVGQARYKLALILATINPAIGGVLVSGPRGSAKSTLARSLAAIAPVAADADAYPFITLPLGASEEMLVGTLNLEQVLSEQRVVLQPGLLAKAHGGALYVDEVNLLPDHLVDLLLDVAASGSNIIERDGISHRHRAQFLLMGTMNPDEGELRPQLRDRFGLSVCLDNTYSLQQRVEIVRRAECFTRDPAGFIAAYQHQQNTLRARIVDAIQRLDTIDCSDSLRMLIAERCQQAQVDGLRADIVWYRAALAHAAWRLSDKQDAAADSLVGEADGSLVGEADGSLVAKADGVETAAVTTADIAAVEALVLVHRRQSPPEEPPSSTPPPFSRPPSRQQGAQCQQQGEYHQYEQDQQDPYQQEHAGEAQLNSQREYQGDWGVLPAPVQTTTTAVSTVTLPPFSEAKPMPARGLTRLSSRYLKPGLRARTASAGGSGVSEFTGRGLDWFATLVASVGRWPLQQLCYRRLRRGNDRLHLVLLDTSASTLENQWLSKAKAAIVAIGEGAYKKREQLTIVGFGNQQLRTLLPQQRAPKALRPLLDTVSAAGGTPLQAVLAQAQRLQQRHYRQYPEVALCTYLITDGRTTQAVDPLQLTGTLVVIDTESTAVKRGRAKDIAQTLGADYFPLPV
ncbi:MAG: ATP-binding protein [Cellvibrionaceae bacterium]|nr:ATP-binding protein [Cellvibrionaceae bacterium]